MDKSHKQETKSYDFLRDPWVVSIGMLFLTPFISWLIDLLTGSNILAHLFFGLSFAVPSWVIALLGLLGVSFARIILLYRVKKDRPVFFVYTKDIFDGVLYKWSYGFSKKGCFVEKFASYCPSCDCKIVRMECQVCGGYFLNEKDFDQVEAMIRFGIKKRFNVDDFNALKA